MMLIRDPGRGRKPKCATALFAAFFICQFFRATPSLAENRWPDERALGLISYHADFSLTRYEKLLTETSGLQRDLDKLLGIGESREPIHLFLFGRKSTYKSYLNRHFPSVPFRRALFVKRRGPGMVFAYVNREFEVDLRHESTHAFLHSSLPHVPLWLDEGLAEYFEVSPERRPYDNPHMSTLRRELRSGSVARMTTLEGMTTLEEMGASQYRHAWAWVHFMLHGPVEAHDELVRYLADIKNALPAGKLSTRLRRRLPNLDQHFVHHFSNWRR